MGGALSRQGVQKTLTPQESSWALLITKLDALPAHYLGCASNHVLDEVPVSWSINDGDVVLGGLKLPEGDVDGDATLPLCLQLVQHPGIFKGALPHLEG